MPHPRTVVVVPGPEGPEPWAAPHHARFRIPDFGEYAGRVSFGAKMSASTTCYVTISARWSRWVEADGVFETVGADEVRYGPSVIGDPAGEFGYRAQIFFVAIAPFEATHWQPVIEWTETIAPGSGLVPGTKVRLDDFFIPDNGHPIDTKPYLDGDQSGARWEGGPHASTSTYGTRTPPPPPPPTIEEEVLVSSGPDFDPDSPTDLDDDLSL